MSWPQSAILHGSSIRVSAEPFPEECGLLQCQGFTRILHCGDMRWQPAMAQHPALAGQPLDVLYLDTTYAAPRHLHPPQVPLHPAARPEQHGLS
jgi:hypothetical protein